MWNKNHIEIIYGSINSRKKKEEQAIAFQERIKKFKEKDYEHIRR